MMHLLQKHYYVKFNILILFFAFTGLLVIGAHQQNPPNGKFQVPMVPLIPALSILFNVGLMFHLSLLTWLRFFVWMIVGKLLKLFFFFFLHS